MGIGSYAGIIGLVFAGSAGFAACSEDIVSLRDEGVSAQFTVDVADDNEERARGLMFVEDMPRMSGMLFVYDRPQRVSFWMRNTLIPLDMVFIDQTGVVRDIHVNAQPLDETPIFGGEDIQFVLEVNGGMSDLLGLKPGAEVRHPAIEKNTAVWPCEAN